MAGDVGQLGEMLGGHSISRAPCRAGAAMQTVPASPPLSQRFLRLHLQSRGLHPALSLLRTDVQDGPGPDMQKVLLHPYCSGPDGPGAALDTAAGTGYPMLCWKPGGH